jgi:hypothetical protein
VFCRLLKEYAGSDDFVGCVKRTSVILLCGKIKTRFITVTFNCLAYYDYLQLGIVLIKFVLPKTLQKTSTENVPIHIFILSPLVVSVPKLLCR